MWFSLVVVVYTGLNPDINLEPTSIVYSDVRRGYPDYESCRDGLSIDSGSAQLEYSQADYTITAQCFQGDPRLANYTTFRPF